MATRAQIKANRNNAKKSTGPRSEEGTARVAKNVLKHGLLTPDTVPPGEDPADFDRQLSALEADIQPANSLEFELVRQIADSQWRIRRLTRLETGFFPAAVADKRYLTQKYHPERLRSGYDEESLLLGSAMLDRTQALVHLARYDGHLSRRFFRAVKQLAELRRDESKAREACSSAGSYTPTDPYPGRYVPAQAPPPIDTPSPTAGRIGFRASRESALQSGLRGDRAPAQQTTPTQTTKQTQSRRTRVETTTSRRRTPAPTARQRCGTGQPGSRGLLETGQSFYGWYCAPQPGRSFRRSARLQRPSGVWGGVTAGRPWRHVSPIENDQTNPISPNSSGINVSNLHFSRAFGRRALNRLCS